MMSLPRELPEVYRDFVRICADLAEISEIERTYVPFSCHASEICFSEGRSRCAMSWSIRGVATAKPSSSSINQ